MKRIIFQRLHYARVSLRRFLLDTIVEEEKQNKWVKFLRVFVLMIVVTIGYIVIGHAKSWPYANEWFDMFSQLF